MGGEIIIFVCLFSAIFGVFYLHYSTRNKERLALIEKGMDAGIFKQTRSQEAPPVWKVLILNGALLMMGIGLGIFVATIIREVNGNSETIQAIFPASVFFMGGLGLLFGFFLTKKYIK